MNAEILNAKNLYKQGKFFQRIEEPNGRSPTGAAQRAQPDGRSPTDLIRWVFLSVGDYFLCNLIGLRQTPSRWRVASNLDKNPLLVKNRHHAEPERHVRYGIAQRAI
jgi:hypothetical protein